MVDELSSVLSREFPIHLGVKLDVEKNGYGARLSWSGPSYGTATFDRVLVAAGRPPALSDLKLAATGLKTNDDGVPEFDLSTTAERPQVLFFSFRSTIRRWRKD